MLVESCGLDEPPTVLRFRDSAGWDQTVLDPSADGGRVDLQTLGYFWDAQPARPSTGSAVSHRVGQR
jgi:hypothetical protein